jgi:hypothetical protein
VTAGSALPAAGFASRIAVAIPSQQLLETTVRATLSFARRQAAGAAVVSSRVIAFAKGGLYVMTISKSKSLAALAILLAAALGWLQTLARSSDLRDPAVPADSAPVAAASQENAAAPRKADTARTSEFPYAVKFQAGASRFLEGDKITIQEVRGTAETMEPGELYWIKGTYTLGSQGRATIAAYTTARSAAEGTSSTLRVQTATVDRGSGTFTLFLPMTCKGWPHVSFYPAEGGSDLGGAYFGTGDSVLKKWWGTK